MKKIKNPQNLSAFLLAVIAFLLTMLGWTAKNQLTATNEMSKELKRFQIETIKERNKLMNEFNINATWTRDVYIKEIQPNTLRSQKNEKDLIKVKSDVVSIKKNLSIN